MEDTMDVDYELSGIAYGHSSDVRDVVAIDNKVFASCSRDGTIRFWRRQNDNTVSEFKTVLGHQNVHKMGTRALAFIQPGSHDIFKEGALVSGGSDKVILVWDAPTWTGDEKEPLMHLIGHLENLTVLGVAPNGDILSASSDMTASVWRGNTTLFELKGHKAAVWAVIALSNGDMVTGSGDRTVKIWRNGQCINTLTNHQDSVRGLADVPGVGFLSASNDAVINFFSYDGTLLQTLEGHEGFIYDVKLLPDGEIVSASEDGTVRIWKDFNCIQVLRHPVGVWRVGVTPSGDIITACQDGIVRVFTRDLTKRASDDVIKQYRTELDKVAQSKAVGDLDLSLLAGEEGLLIPGTSDGETKLIKKDGKVLMYSWTAAKTEWTAIGEVMDAKDTKKGKNEGQSINGKIYDHVWDVEIGDGGPMKKIGYNNGDNPYQAAQQFISDNELDQNFLEDIAKFIIRNVGDSAARAVNERRAAPTQSAPTQSPPAQSKPAAVPLCAQPSLPSSGSKHFPVLKALLFETGNIDPIIAKIKSLNDAEEFKNNPAGLSILEVSYIESIGKKIAQTRSYHVSVFTDKELAVLEKLLTQWPVDKIFPVLDVLRLMGMHPQAVRQFAESKFLQLIISRGTTAGGHQANAALAFRAVCNCFSLESARDKLRPFQATVIEHGIAAYESANANAKLAIGSALLNFSILNITQRADQASAELAKALFALLSASKRDTEGEESYLLLSALGNSIFWSGGVRSAMKSFAGELTNLQKHGSAKVREAAADIAKLLA